MNSCKNCDKQTDRLAYAYRHTEKHKFLQTYRLSELQTYRIQTLQDNRLYRLYRLTDLDTYRQIGPKNAPPLMVVLYQGRAGVVDHHPAVHGRPTGTQVSHNGQGQHLRDDKGKTYLQCRVSDPGCQ